MTEPQQTDIVSEARRVLKDASRIHALHDSDPKKDEDVSWLVEALANENTALREQLAQQRETIKFWQRHIQRMGKLLETVAIDTEVEKAVKELQSRLAQARLLGYAVDHQGERIESEEENPPIHGITIGDYS